MIITLPLPPSKNEIKIPVRGRLIHTTKYNKYKKMVYPIIVEQLVHNPEMRYIYGQPMFKPTLEVQLELKIKVYLKDKRRDATNIIEPLLDVLKGYLYDDDKYILVNMEEIKLDPHNPRVEVIV